MQSEVQKLIDASGAQAVGVAYRNLGSGSEWFVEPDRPFHAASTMKIGVMMEAYRQSDEGYLNLDDMLTLANKFKSVADGSAYSLSAKDDSDPELYKEIKHPKLIEELVRRMIVKSSNLATNELLLVLGVDHAQQLMDELGAPSVKIVRGVEDSAAYKKGLNNTTTAAGLCTILSKLANKEVVSAKASEQMLEILLAQEHNEGIPEGVKAGSKVAHKTGWNDGIYHDAGIVYPKKGDPFVLVVLTEGFKEEKGGAKLVASIAKAVSK
jgi:beta-lactamase class A